MKNRGNKRIILAIVMLVFCAGVYRIGIIIFGANGYSFSLDPLFSAQMQIAIKTAAQQSQGKSLAAIAQSIANLNPAIGPVRIERCANKSISISCKSVAPYLQFLNEKIVLQNGHVVDKKTFTNAAVEQLPLITCKTDLKNPSRAFVQWLLQLPAEIVTAYSITWADDYEIYLADKTNSHTSILCSIDSTIDEKIREKCQHIIQEKSDGGQGTARSLFYTADIRFKKQIIVCSQKGGACHG